MPPHEQLIKLIVGYTLAGALVFTVVATCLSLIGWVKFADPGQQQKLFTALIVEIVVVSVGFFGGLLNFNPVTVEQRIKEVEQYKVLSAGLSRFVFSVEILAEYLQKQWTTEESLRAAVTEYNEAITDLRSNEASNRQLLGINQHKSSVTQFDHIMELVRRIDESIHGLNDEFEKISILRSQVKMDPDRAQKAAAELRPQVSEIKSEVLKLFNSDAESGQ